MTTNLILITGCSGGGKSTLLAALDARGYATVAEPGRRIVTQERAGNGAALPWVDLQAFALRAIDMARADLVNAVAKRGPVFFDRGLIDAAVALEFAGGAPYRETLGTTRHHSKTVFVAPPWPEIFCQEADRQHDFDAATDEYTRLTTVLIELGYDVVTLPKAPVEHRVDFVLQRLNLDASPP